MKDETLLLLLGGGYLLLTQNPVLQAISSATNAASTVGQDASGISAGVEAALESTGNALYQAGSGAASTVGTDYTGLVTGVASFFQNEVSALQNFFGQTVNWGSDVQPAKPNGGNTPSPVTPGANFETTTGQAINYSPISKVTPSTPVFSSTMTSQLPVNGSGTAVTFVSQPTPQPAILNANSPVFVNGVQQPNTVHYPTAFA